MKISIKVRFDVADDWRVLGLHDSVCSVCFKSILFPSFGKKSYSWNSLTAMEISIEGQDGCC